MLAWKKKGDILYLLDGWQQSAGELSLLKALDARQGWNFWYNTTIAQLEEKLDTLAACPEHWTVLSENVDKVVWGK